MTNTTQSQENHLAFTEIAPIRDKGGNRSAHFASFKAAKNSLGILLLTAAGLKAPAAFMMAASEGFDVVLVPKG